MSAGRPLGMVARSLCVAGAFAVAATMLVYRLESGTVSPWPLVVAVPLLIAGAMPPLRFLDPRPNVFVLRELTASLWKYRELLLEMTKRDLFDRFAGQALGGVWAILQPLVLMLLYTFVFTFIFRLRMSSGDAGASYVVHLLAALAPWLAMQEALGRAADVIVGEANLVKQIVFPIEILPLKTVLSTVVMLAVGLAFPVLIALFSGTARPVFWLLLPIPVMSQLLLVSGLVYLLSAVGVFVRDVRDIVPLLLTVGLFLHPILYIPGQLSAWAEAAFYMSPISHVLWMYRDVVVFGAIMHPLAWIVGPSSGILSFVLGYRVFRSLRHNFGNVL
jgi:lipopolysaccharide transport system permease protein